MKREEKQERERGTVLLCTCQQFHLWSEVIRERIVRRTTDLNKKGKEKRREKKMREGINKKKMTNPRVHILADQDQLTGHSQGRYSTDKDNLIVHHCLMIIEYLDTIYFHLEVLRERERRKKKSNDKRIYILSDLLSFLFTIQRNFKFLSKP